MNSPRCAFLQGKNQPPHFAKVDYSMGGVPYSIAGADLNTDSKPDLVVANFSSNTVSVLLNSCVP
jgi:hypothetical protein